MRRWGTASGERDEGRGGDEGRGCVHSCLPSNQVPAENSPRRQRNVAKGVSKLNGRGRKGTHPSMSFDSAPIMPSFQPSGPCQDDNAGDGGARICTRQHQRCFYMGLDAQGAAGGGAARRSGGLRATDSSPRRGGGERGLRRRRVLWGLGQWRGTSELGMESLCVADGLTGRTFVSLAVRAVLMATGLCNTS
ncbi:hypothetical protein B0H16DRAFT_1605630 [Mycena metata]|uniref:Uncharacterized protein n=1 Tax=Mycena metata TaxID=1033252 RepID=A0AAD7MJ12_9AGAR|nr:hypothetical protein B0H16DRAFT_1605630 [Mycena metata]